MRIFLALLLFGAAFWRAAVDWQATIGQGYAYRFGTLGSLIRDRWPASYARFVEGVAASGIPYAWDPVGAVVMALPVALVLAVLGLAVWVTRARARAR